MHSVPEPRVVVANREDLWWLLSEAAQLEHMIMCQYLFAEFGLKQGSDEGLSPEQARVVDGWRKTLHSIAVDEMLHMALVANVSTAIGAAPTLGRPNFPQRSGFFPSPIQLDLLPFGERALQHFLYLERPEGMERLDAEGFVATAPPRAPLAADESMPRGQEFATIGHLYRGIDSGLRTLAARVGEMAVFVGSPRAQATPELFHWPQLIVVTDLTSASAAVAEIIEQGEGARGDWQHAHYGRFLNILQEYHEQLALDPSFEPTRPVLAAYTRQPFDSAAPVPIITEPLTHRVAELAALAYELVLQTLNRFFTHTDESDEQLGILVRVAVGTMAGVLRPLATELTRLPVGASHADCTAGFAFEMFYTMGNFVPWRESAWALLYERMSLLADRCATAATDPSEPGGIRQAHQRALALAALLAEHVPASLRPASATS